MRFQHGRTRWYAQQAREKARAAQDAPQSPLLARDGVLVLVGIDPGYANMGLARVALGEGRTIRDYRQATVGVPAALAPELYIAFFGPVLREWFQGASAVGAEAITEPQYQGGKDWGAKIGTWMRMGVVVGIATAIASEMGIPYNRLQPQQLKVAAAGDRSADKADMKEVVRSFVPDFAGTDHAADAFLAALACWAPEMLAARKLGLNFHAQ